MGGGFEDLKIHQVVSFGDKNLPNELTVRSYYIAAW